MTFSSLQTKFITSKIKLRQNAAKGLKIKGRSPLRARETRELLIRLYQYKGAKIMWKDLFQDHILGRGVDIYS